MDMKLQGRISAFFLLFGIDLITSVGCLSRKITLEKLDEEVSAICKDRE